MPPIRASRAALLAVRDQRHPWPSSTWPTGQKAEVFAGRQSPHPAAADLFHKLLAALALAAAAGCAGYRVGNNTLYAPNVRTVYVPMFQSDSFRTTPSIDAGERLTEAVCKEIEKRTPFKVVGSEGAADSVLTGRIVADTKRMVVESPTDQSRQVELNYQVLVTWADRGGSVIASGEVPLPAATVDIGQAASVVPEFGRSVASTQQEAIVKLAQQIVGLMEEPW